MMADNNGYLVKGYTLRVCDYEPGRRLPPRDDELGKLLRELENPPDGKLLRGALEKLPGRRLPPLGNDDREGKSVRGTERVGKSLRGNGLPPGRLLPPRGNDGDRDGKSVRGSGRLLPPGRELPPGRPLPPCGKLSPCGKLLPPGR